MTRKERITLDRRHALSQINILYAIGVECKDVLKRRQKSKVLRTKPAIVNAVVYVPKEEL